MKNKRKYWLFLLSMWLYMPLLWAGDRPTGLMTDLLEHTDCTWQNGFASTVPVWQLDKTIEPLQYAAIRSSRPSFTWIVPGEKADTRQTSYRLIVADNWSDISACRGNVWDSGMVESNQSVAVGYQGEELRTNGCYFWRVQCVTNTEGTSPWSDIKAFRTASELSDYAASCYPLVKSLEEPVSVKTVSAGTSLIDFGKDAFAQLVLTFTSSREADTVTVHLGECMEQGRLLRHRGKLSIRYRCWRLPLLKGTHTYRLKVEKDKQNTGGAAVKMPAYVGEVLPFRYCEIEGLQPSAVARETVHYPFDETASAFRSSNDTLNQIWDLCKYSIKATSFTGYYVDGDRERIPYEADALINQLCHYGVDREYAMARRTHEYLLKRPTWPTEWILQSILIAWQDYMYTGDSRSLASCYEQLKPRLLMALREKNGLISTRTGLQSPDFLKSICRGEPIRDIVDWPRVKPKERPDMVGGESDGFVFTDYNAVTNAFHYEALKRMAQIASVIGREDDARLYASEVERFSRLYVKSFFDREQRRFVDGMVEDTVKHASLHANMFPLAFGLVPSGKRPEVVGFIRSRGMACSVYASQFLMDALYGAGEADYALYLLTKSDDRSWYNMIRLGSTISLEAWDNLYKPNQDWNHAWGAAPANIIPRRLMGVQPLEAGFETVRICPQVGSLEWAEATVPTIRGTIGVKVENKPDMYRLTVTVPANMDAEVYLPLPSGRYQVHVNDTKVKPRRVKGEPFVYVGKVGSGTYTWELVHLQ